MPKQKKDSCPFSIRMATDIYNRMNKYCEDTGMPKTTVIERAIIMYLDDYDETQEQLKQLKSEPRLTNAKLV